MERILVRPTCYEIHDYDLGEAVNLEKAFQIWDPLYHKLHNFGMYYDGEKRILYIGSGCDLWFVKRELNEKYFTKIDYDEPIPTPKRIMMSVKPRSEQQYEAIKFTGCLGEYEENMIYSQYHLGLSTGIGKSFVSIATIALYQMKAAIITASVTLLNQWKNEIIKFTNLKEEDIMFVSGSDHIRMLLSGKSKKAEQTSIFLFTHGSLRSYADQFGWDKIGVLFKSLGIGLKFYDEAHSNFENVLMIDFFTNTKKTFYVTATLNRSNFREDRIMQITFKNVPKIDLWDAESDPHTRYTAIKFNSKPTPLDIKRCKNKYGLDINRYTNYLTRKPEFYQMMHIIMQIVINGGGITLMYIHTNDGVLRVYKWIAMTYPQFLGDIGIFTSLLPKEEKIKEKNKKLILTTIKSAGLGEHIEGLKRSIVIADPFRSEVLARQSLGRTRDPDTDYIELVDLGFKYTNRFYRAKLPVFNKYACEVNDIHIDQYELRKRYENIVRQRIPWRESPIEFYDDRFEFPDDFKEKEPQNPNSPIEFFDEDDLSNWTPIY